MSLSKHQSRFIRMIVVMLIAAAASGCSVLASKKATVVCQAADAVTTAVVLHNTSAHEANPIMAGVIKNFGIPGLFLVKALIAWWLIEADIPQGVKAGINVATCGIAAHNVGVGIGLAQ